MQKPRRRPGESIFEKEPQYTTLLPSSKAFTGGMCTPSKESSPYGLSSIIIILFFFAISYTARLFFSDMVMPEGFWKFGMVYNILTFSFSEIAFSSASMLIPSSSIGTPHRCAPYERKALSAPINDGSSTITVSPSLSKTFAVRSIPC